MSDDFDILDASLPPCELTWPPPAPPAPDRLAFLRDPAATREFSRPRDILAGYHAHTRRIVHVIVAPLLVLATLGAGVLALRLA